MRQEIGYHNELKNRFIHVDYNKMMPELGEEQQIQSANEDIPKCKNCTLDELAIRIGKSERTIKTGTVEMQEKTLFEGKMVNVMESGKF